MKKLTSERDELVLGKYYLPNIFPCIMDNTGQLIDIGDIPHDDIEIICLAWTEAFGKRAMQRIVVKK